ncbi:hypothetical protein AB1Y20_020591 [Prymnesium parvum]|uniref:B9 domain-containing protein 1 n=1 Tax=Prymnesium parvum TaxID=97485 RepID=A0AB34JXV8_PRYPA|mmetsp:Transcript_18129/g.45465  ORF Transcript_18129/g.45465 Transcript_18129/m.45465 type:complete len:212 (+) Transcript_18129:15-650(+)
MAEGGSAMEPSHFVVMVTGQLESGRYEGLDSLYCRYAFAFGDDWKVVSGVEEGISQLSTASGSGGEQGLLAIWNFPVDVTFRATSAHGWPQMVVSVYGSDSFGRSDVIFGYGATHLPIAPGRHELYIRTFRPLASSLWLRFRSWMSGMRPEFIDSLFPSKSEGRDVTRVQSFGVVKLQLDVTIQGMEALGYQMPPVQRTPLQLHDPFLACN